LRAAFWHHANFVAQFRAYRNSARTAAYRFEAGAIVFHDYVAAVGPDAQLG